MFDDTVLVLEMALGPTCKRPPVNISIIVDGQEINSLSTHWECIVPTAPLQLSTALTPGSRNLTILVVIDHPELATKKFYVVRDLEIHGKLRNIITV